MGLMLDQPGRPLGDMARQGGQAGGDRIARLDRLADVVQQGGQLEFLVVGECGPGQLEDLQAVIQGVSLGMDIWDSA